jgi:mannan endo-1,4-beta-mannosidase
MMKKQRHFFYLLILVFHTSFGWSQEYKNCETERLYSNLKKLSGKSIMFGMANPTTIDYLRCKNDELNQSDCKDITGSHPAFHESDLMWYRDSAFQTTDMAAMKAAFQRGAVCGYCWHLGGMESGSFYAREGDTTLVKQIVAGGQREENMALDWYLDMLDELAIPVFKKLDFPLVFRPFHEMNGSWFWWGRKWCTREEYISLFRLTVDYLRHAGIQNLLYAWSPDAASAMEFYPGDDYVDILGMDIYEPGVDPNKSHERMLKALGELTDYAAARDKVVAITECGCRKDGERWRYPDLYPDFWTRHVLKPVLSDARARRIVWITAWYNADWEGHQKGQFYIPYKALFTPPGKQCIQDFIQFYNHPLTIFEDDLPDMYL